MTLYWQLFITFFKIGLFTFGGGWAMIAIIQREIVDNHKWIEKEEFLDLLAVAQSMPGILAVNISTVIGDRLRGLRGSIVAALGTILPSFFIVSRIFKGIRPAVVALIVAPVITTARAAGITWRTVIIPVAVALLIYSGIPVISSPILYIVLGAVVGYVMHVRKLANQRKTPVSHE